MYTHLGNGGRFVMKNKERFLAFLDIVELIVVLNALIIFTIIFKLDIRITRYLFLLGDVVFIITFSNTLSHLEKLIQKRIVKNPNTMIEQKYVKKISFSKTISS